MENSLSEIMNKLDYLLTDGYKRRKELRNKNKKLFLPLEMLHQATEIITAL